MPRAVAGIAVVFVFADEHKRNQPVAGELLVYEIGNVEPGNAVGAVNVPSLSKRNKTYDRDPEEL